MGTASTPLQQVQFSLDDFKSEEGINRLNQHLTNVVRTLNANIGTGGPVAMPSGIDAQGSKITNVGGVGPEHEAVSRSYAEANYSATAIKPKLEGGGSHALQTVRRIGDSTQREPASSWLNGLMSTSPTANTSTISASGSTVTISAGFHEFLDGSVASYASRSDTLAASTPIAIVSITRTGGIVTIVTSGPSGVFASDEVTIAGVTPSSFDGTFVVSNIVNPTTFQYAQSGADLTGSGGTLTTSTIFFYSLLQGQKTLSLSRPFDTDTQTNRIEANRDGSILIAVVAVNGSGIDLSNSMSGATPPAVTGNARIINRL